MHKVARATSPVRASRVSQSHAARDGLAISSQSLGQYQDRATSLHKRWQKETGGRDLASFSRWLLTLKPGVASTTWRHYRVACLYWMESQRDSAIAMAILDDDARAGAPIKRDRSALKSSGQREKRLPPDHLDRLVTYLRMYVRTNNAMLAAALLEVGVLVGLRPEEFRDTVIFGDSLWVRCVKTDNGKGVGPWRTLDLSEFRCWDIDKIQDLSDWCRDLEHNGIFDVRIRSAGRVITSSCRRLWPGRKGPRYCLYDARHQFVANSKAAVSRVAVAAMLGHKNTKTATKAYASARSSWPPSKRPVTPMPPGGVMQSVVENHRSWTPKPKSGQPLPIPRRQGNTVTGVG